MKIIIVIGFIVNMLLYMIGKNDKWGEQLSDESYCCGQMQTPKEQYISRIDISRDAVLSILRVVGTMNSGLQLGIVVQLKIVLKNC